MDTLFVVVHYDGTEFELGSCDCDHVSLIALLHIMYEKKIGSDKVPNEEYCVWVFCPWSGERKEVNSDMKLVHVFRLFIDHKVRTIRFEIENKPYIPLPPNLGFTEFPNNYYNYEGDNEVDDAKIVLSGDSEEVVEVDDVMPEDSVLGDKHGVGDESDKVNEGGSLGLAAVVDEEDINVNLELFEGYQSKSDDEYFSELEDEKAEAKIARLMKGKW
ncbi:hypothetical protein Ddye_016384 [Dipteronia dyeriana]|uniref:Uncharacterized protein n=1 Tax=Dipteronia dyeriana TaxID=168575 RepID=A0AAD9U7G2_9ROSI|nr:hypothetical protein Ddye_016384 [Dipteronia dyeriana]